MKNNNISLSPEEFEAMKIINKISHEATSLTIPVFIENIENAVKKNKAAHLIKDDMPDF